MKTIKIILSTTGVILFFFLIMSFIRVNTSQKIKQIQQPGSKGFAVVELFTSEGCSSCPPADELIENIRQQNQQKRLYILAYHVDYWDHQGWKDRFSKPEFTERQNQYAAWMKLETIYTPQAVINGESEHVGSNKPALVNDIASQLETPSSSRLSIQATVDNGKLLIQHNTVLQKNEELLLALVQKNGSSNVRAGENKGRNLTHVQIVREMIHADTKNNNRSIMKLPADFSTQGWELIGLIQNKQDGHITDAISTDFK